MEELQKRLDQLNAMIAKGIRVGRLGDEQVEFRDLNDMFRVRADLERQIAALEGKARPSRQHYPTFSRGT